MTRASLFLLTGTLALAQTPVATMKQLMLDIIHPASNEILLDIYRAGPADDDNTWASLRRSALTLAESGNLLALRNDQPVWKQDARLLADAGAAAYKAAQAKDAKALAATAASIDAACTTCHRHSRPDVFPK